MTRRRARVLALLLLPLAALLSLSGVATAQVPHAHHVATAVVAKKKLPKITISSFAFTVPKHVAPGAKMKVVNRDSVEHSVTSDDGAWPSVDVPAKSTVTFKAPDKVGKYPFHCRFHPEMTGLLKVKKTK